MDMINEVELRQLLRAEYEVDKPEITLIRTGGDGNHTFKITGGSVSYIARVYGEQGRNHPDWARYELELLAYLADHGVSVAAPVAARDGTLMQSFPTNSETPVPVALFTFAEGSVEWPTSSPRAHLLGAAFAQMHGTAEGFRTTAEHRSFDIERLLSAPLRRMHEYLVDSDPDDGADWEILSKTAEQAAAMFTAIPVAGGAIGPIHGDLHQGNCHFNQADRGDLLTFFDFSNAGVGWRVYDLSGFLWPLRDDTIQDPAIRASCDAFLDGYRSVRPLLSEEEKAIIASVKARDFWEAGCWLEFGDNLEPNTVRVGLHSLADQFRRFPLVG